MCKTSFEYTITLKAISNWNTAFISDRHTQEDYIATDWCCFMHVKTDNVNDIPRLQNVRKIYADSFNWPNTQEVWWIGHNRQFNLTALHSFRVENYQITGLLSQVITIVMWSVFFLTIFKFHTSCGQLLLILP